MDSNETAITTVNDVFLIKVIGTIISPIKSGKTKNGGYYAFIQLQVTAPEYRIDQKCWIKVFEDESINCINEIIQHYNAGDKIEVKGIPMVRGYTSSKGKPLGSLDVRPLSITKIFSSEVDPNDATKLILKY